MILNRLEYLLMNNPVRAAIQRHFEGPRFAHMGGVHPGAYTLEIGCGRGVGTEIILNRFRAARVDALDLDPRMVQQAQKRLQNRPARLCVADAAALPAQAATYDAVFDFGIIHHVLDWRKALAEISRVLKPGGRLYAEEALRDFITEGLCRALFKHPWEDRFDHEQFLAAMRQAGLTIIASTHIWNRFGWYVGQKCTS